MERYLKEYINNDLNNKIVLMSGPRQSGKTYLSKMLTDSFEYLNYDYPEHRLILKEKSYNRNKQILILDEIHKMKNWKSWLKGIYDVEGNKPKLLVTGSSRLDIIRKTGDSLAGRYFMYRLHPFDIKEVKNKIKPENAFDRLLNVGGFPEPFLKNDIEYYNRWKKSHLDIILRQDLLDIESVRNIKSIETLIELLRERVGSPISYSSLSRDLEHDPKTIKRWLGILENMYIIFAVRPYNKNIARSILKEPKYYFYDNALVKKDFSIKLENIVACALLKELNFLEDAKGYTVSLNYLKTKENKEIDFAVFINNKIYLIEVKTSDDNLSKNFLYFKNIFPKAFVIQLVKNLKHEKTYQNGALITDVVNWLKDFNFAD